MEGSKKASIEDIIAMNALYRPGPMDYIPNFIEGRKNQDNIKYTCPQLQPILSPTYGCIVYQEQVMQIFRDLAGYSWGRSDLVRRAMSKKHTEELLAERNNFVYGNPELKIKGCVNNGIPEDAANKIFDDMTDFAKYAFNKSHATAYSILSYYTAWLKTYYPAEYMCNVMNYCPNIEKLKDTIADARDFGLEVLPPDINQSAATFTVVDGKILFGLSSVKNVGDAANLVIKARQDAPFKDIKDFIMRCKINSRALTNLIAAGAFDTIALTRSSINPDRVYMKDLLDLAADIFEKEDFVKNAYRVKAFVSEYCELEEFKERIQNEGIKYKVTSKKMPTEESIQKRIYAAVDKIKAAKEEFYDIEIERIPDDKEAIYEKEKEVLGLYLTGSPLDEYRIVTDPISDITDSADGNEQSISGIITNLKVRTSKKDGSLWASFELEDRTGTIQCTAFPSDYSRMRDNLKEGAALMITGKVSVDTFSSTEEETVYKMIAKTADRLYLKDTALCFVTKNIDTWVEHDYQMLKEYEDIYGTPLYVYNETTGTKREANFKVCFNATFVGAKAM